MTKNLTAAILAGGANKRYNGITKASVLVGGRTIISRIIGTINNIFDDIIIVTNTPAEFREYEKYNIISDQILDAGPLGGIHAAIKASTEKALFVFAGDMPLLDRTLILRQIEQYNADESDILVPMIGSSIEPLHAIYNCSIAEPLEDYLKEKRSFAVREFFNLVRVSYFILNDSPDIKAAFTNINSPADVSHVEKLSAINLHGSNL